MKTLILEPQFIDRAGRVVYHVHEDDETCRIRRPGKLIGQVRFDDAGFEKFECIEQGDLPLEANGD